jgi:hypothetical protein
VIQAVFAERPVSFVSVYGVDTPSKLRIHEQPVHTFHSKNPFFKRFRALTHGGTIQKSFRTSQINYFKILS